MPVKEQTASRLVLAGSVFILALTLFTNQYFHGGVYGKLHNLSVKPHVTISNAFIQNNTLSFTVFRDQGADVYGSFLIGIKLKDQHGNIIFEQNQTQLSNLAKEQIKNDYIAQVKPGKHSLILPLGAKATLHFKIASVRNPTAKYLLELTDISGENWIQEVTL